MVPGSRGGGRAPDHHTAPVLGRAEYGGASIGVDAPGYYVPTATLRAVEDGAEDLRSNWCPMPTQVCAAVESGAARLHAESFGCASHLEFDCVWSWDNATAANASGQTHRCEPHPAASGHHPGAAPDPLPGRRVSSHLAFTSGPVECPFPEGMGAEAAPYLRLHLASRANATVVPGSSIHTSIPLLHNNVTFTFSGTAWEPLTCPCSSACSGECAPAPESLPHPTECPAYVRAWNYGLHPPQTMRVGVAQALSPTIVPGPVQRHQRGM